jgi:PKD repeat protein
LYTVKVTATNASATGKNAVVGQFTIEVPNFTAANGYFVDDLYNDVGEKYTLSVGISNIDDFLPRLELNRDVKLAVSGLPTGLKYDAKTGKITGVATKAGIYTVTLTVTDGKEKYVSTITIEVEALPDWVVGTFRGIEYDRSAPYWMEEVPWVGGNFWDVVMTISSGGNVVGKLLEPNGKQMYTVQGNLIDNGDGSYFIKGWQADESDDVEYLLLTREYQYGDIYLGKIHFETHYYWEDGERYVQDWWLVKDVYESHPKNLLLPDFEPEMKIKESIEDEESGIFGEIRMTFASKGAVVGQFTPYSNVVMVNSRHNGHLILVSYDENVRIACGYVLMSFAHKYNGRELIGILYKLEINVDSGEITVVDRILRYD